MFNLGARVIAVMGGRIVPGTVTDEAVHESQVTLANGNTITVFRQEVITLREKQDGTKYLMQTPENLRFVYRRPDPVVGLDFDESGDPITLDELNLLVAQSTAAWQATRLDARQDTEVPLDLTPEPPADPQLKPAKGAAAG